MAKRTGPQGQPPGGRGESVPYGRQGQSVPLSEGTLGPCEQRGNQGPVNAGHQGAPGGGIVLPTGWSSNYPGPVAQGTPPPPPPPPTSESK